MRLRSALLVAAVTLLALTAGRFAPALAAERLEVVTSFSILGDLVREVGGDAVEVTSLVGPGGDAHVYQPSPADARAIAGADLVVMNGLGFEGWIDRLVAASGYQGPVVVASRRVEPRAAATEPASPVGQFDPHAFQSVPNTILYVQEIAAALERIDPVAADTVTRNAERYTATLQALDVEIRQAISGLPADRRDIITSHDAFGYFGATYGITFLAPVGLSTEAEPSAGDVASLVRQIRATGARALFVENISDPRLLEQIARETAITVGGELYSDALSPPDGPAASYVEMMRYNTRTITGALGS